MNFVVFVDGSANLPKKMIDNIRVLPCSYLLDGENVVYAGEVEAFDYKAFYDGLRNGKSAKTSLLNTDLFLEYFRPVLLGGQDILYVSMSSGISGTFNAARLAAEELKEEFPERYVHIVDSLGCGFGNGILALKAAQLSKQGMDCREAAKIVDEAVPHACQYFTVDDLNFLKKTGRVSGVTATIGTVLNIKPILFGDSTGHIISCGKTRGRKASIDAIARKYEEKRMDCPDKTVCISHGDCIEDANYLASLVKKISPDADITICLYLRV